MTHIEEANSRKIIGKCIKLIINLIVPIIDVSQLNPKFSNTDAFEVKLHFPAVLPTYAKFNHVWKDYIENKHESVVEILRSDEFFNLFYPEKTDSYSNAEKNGRSKDEGSSHEEFKVEESSNEKPKGSVKWLLEEIFPEDYLMKKRKTRNGKIFALLNKMAEMRHR
jgi:hypothetical protein